VWIVVLARVRLISTLGVREFFIGFVILSMAKNPTGGAKRCRGAEIPGILLSTQKERMTGGEGLEDTP
jgi:hypothetical protein